MYFYSFLTTALQCTYSWFHFELLDHYYFILESQHSYYYQLTSLSHYSNIIRHKVLSWQFQRWIFSYSSLPLQSPPSPLYFRPFGYTNTPLQNFPTCHPEGNYSPYLPHHIYSRSISWTRTLIMPFLPSRPLDLPIASKMKSPHIPT